MFIRRSLPVSVILAIILTLVLSVSVASAQTATEVRVGGSVVFRDSDASSDSLTIALTAVPQPAAGHAYQGWLIGADGTTLSTGVMVVTSGGSVSGKYVSPSGENLLAKFGTFAISQETSPDADPATPGSIIYADNIPADVYPQVVSLVTDSAKGLKDQATLLSSTMTAAQGGADLASKQAHAAKVGAIADAIAVHGAAAITAINNAIAAADDSTVQACDGTTVKKQTVDCNATAATAAVNKVTSMAAQAKSNAAAVVAATSDDTSVRLRLESGVISADSALDNAKTAYTKSQDIGKLIPIRGGEATPPGVGDELVPFLGLMTLLAGLACAAFGGMIILRRRGAVDRIR